MRVKDLNRKTKPVYVAKCLEWMLRIFSLDSGQSKIFAQDKFIFLSKAAITAFLFAGINLYSFRYKLQNVFPQVNVSISVTDTIQMIFDYCQYIIDLYFVYKYGRQFCLEYYKQYECFDNLLNTNNYAEINRKQVRLFVVFGVVWWVVSATDFVAWHFGYSWMVSLIYSPAYLFMLIKILTNLDLTAQVINIECRLQVIGDIVQDYYSSADQLPCNAPKDHIRDTVGNQNWFYGWKMEVKLANQLKTLRHHSYHEIKWLSRCYLLLTEQCVFIEKMFGVRILLNSLSLLIDMVRFLNAAVRIAVGTQDVPSRKFDAVYMPVVSSTMRWLECIAVITSLVFHCENVYRQRDRIADLATHLLINKNPEDSLRAAVSELQALVSSSPMVFSVAHFFTLNYSFLLSMISVVVTYTIILLQSM